MRLTRIAAVQVVTLLWLGAAAPSASAQSVFSALAHPGRPPSDVARDAQRKPNDILTFSGIKAGEKVVDLVPGNGYFTRMLSTLVGPRGKVYPYVPIVGNAQTARARERAAMAKGETPPPNPVDQVLAIQNIQPEYGNVMVLWESITALGLPEQVDVVFMVDAYRRIRSGEFGNIESATVNRAVFDALKPGGLFYVVDSADASTAMRAEVVAAGFAVEGAAGDGSSVAARYRKPANAPADKRPKGDPLKAWYGNTFTLGTLTERNRTIFHHPDGTYHEFGMNDMQSGYSYWAADGRNCMLHQFPPEQRGFVTCHQYPTADIKKVGEMWIEGGPNHLMPYKDGDPRPAVGQGTIVGLTQGYVYPNVAAGRGQGPAVNAPPPAGSQP